MQFFVVATAEAEATTELENYNLEEGTGEAHEWQMECEVEVEEDEATDVAAIILDCSLFPLSLATLSDFFFAIISFF